MYGASSYIANAAQVHKLVKLVLDVALEDYFLDKNLHQSHE